MGRLVIVIARDGDVWVFASADRAADWMEAQDVRDGEYRAFDCDGSEYSVSAASDDAPVVISGPSQSASDKVLVAEAASRFISAADPSSSPRGRDAADSDLCVTLEKYAQ